MSLYCFILIFILSCEVGFFYKGDFLDKLAWFSVTLISLYVMCSFFANGAFILFLFLFIISALIGIFG